MNKGRTNRISGGQLMCLLMMTRLATLMLSRSMSFILLLVELAVSATLSLAVYLLDRTGMEVHKKPVIFALSVPLLALQFLDGRDYFIFTKTVSHTDVPIWLIMALFVVFSLYAGLLGTEAVARFSALGLIVVLLFIIVAIHTNLKAFRADFLAVLPRTKITALPLLRCADVPLFYLLLAPRTADKKGRALLVGNAVPYALFALVILMCRAVMGRTAEIYRAPVFALYQLGEIGTFTKLDILYVCAVLVLLLSETALAVSIILGERRLKK